MPIPSDSKYILEVVYNCGLHDERSVHAMVSKMTKLTMKQISQWFRTKRWQDKKSGLSPPSRLSPRNKVYIGEKGQWTPESRKLLEICFEEGYCVPENFCFLEQLTGLTQTQINQWVRDKRWACRQKTLPGEALPPEEIMDFGSDTIFSPEDEFVPLGTKRERDEDDSYLDINCRTKPKRSKRLKGLKGHLRDPIVMELLENAWSKGCLKDRTNYEIVAVLAGIQKQDLLNWIEAVKAT